MSDDPATTRAPDTSPPRVEERPSSPPPPPAIASKPDASAAPPASGAPRSAPERAPAPEGVRVTVDLRAETSSAVVRGATPGFGASVRFDAPEPTGRPWLPFLLPSLGIGIRQSLPKDRTLRGGSVELLWTAGHLRLCPFRLPLFGVLALSPCAEANAGVLRADASGFAEARRASTFWLDVGASIWMSVDLSKRLFLSTTLLVTLPVKRQPFTLASGTAVATVPEIGALAGIGLGARL